MNRIHVVIINRDGNDGAWRKITAQLAVVDSIVYERFDEIDQEKASLCDWQIPQAHKGKLPPETPESYFKQQLITRLNHYYSLRLAKECKYDAVVIMEDDILLDEEKVKILSQAVQQLSFSYLFMYGPYIKDDKNKLSYQINNRLLKTCYAVKASHYDELITLIENQMNDPIEDILYQLLNRNQQIHVLFPANELNKVIDENSYVKPKTFEQNLEQKLEEKVQPKLEEKEEKKSYAVIYLNRNNTTAHFDAVAKTAEIDTYHVFKSDASIPDFALWQELIENPHIKYYVIFSDLIKLVPNLMKKVDALLKNIETTTTQLDVLFLGYEMDDLNLAVNIDTYRPDEDTNIIHLSPLNTELYSHGLFAYIISKSGATKLISYAKSLVTFHAHDLFSLFKNNLLELNLHETRPHLALLEKATLPTPPVFPDYHFYPDIDLVGEEMRSFKEKTIAELKKESDSDEKCEGFNTYGVLKANIKPPMMTVFTPKPLINMRYSPEGFYVKKSIMKN